MHGFDPRKPLSAEVKLYLGKAMDAAVEALQDQPDGRDEAIHKARKALKNARALLKLSRDLSPKRFTAATRRLAIAAKGISKARDAAALVECAEWLNPYLAENDAGSLGWEMRNRLETRYADHIRSTESLEKQITSAITLCRTTASSIRKADYKRDGEAHKILAAGWVRRHKKAVRALAACRANGEEENFHDLRKCAQQTVYQTRFLARAWPTGIGAIEAEALELAKLLGHEHDLTMLLALEKSEPGMLCDPEAHNQLLTLLEARRAVLREDAIKIGDALYSGYWKNEGKRIKRLWKMMQ